MPNIPASLAGTRTLLTGKVALVRAIEASGGKLLAIRADAGLSA